MTIETTASGLQYEDVVVGDGAEATAGKYVTVHYTCWLYENGQAVGSAPVVNGVATLANYFPFGPHNFTAKYNGDALYNASPLSAVKLVKVTGQLNTKLKVTASAITHGFTAGRPESA